MHFPQTPRAAAGLVLAAAVASMSALAAPSSSPARGPAPVVDAGRIDAVFKDFRPGTPGCAVGVYARGRVLYAKGFGMADLGQRVPIRPETMFDVGSLSKQFTATTVLMLAEQGRLRLDDDIRRWLPWLPSTPDRITIDDLLHQTSGLRDYIDLLIMTRWRTRPCSVSSSRSGCAARTSVRTTARSSPGAHGPTTAWATA